jgi:formate dehydrogenase
VRVFRLAASGVVRAEAAPRLMAINIDEANWAFRDRHYSERDPHRFLEGI